MESILEVKNLTMDFGGLRALDDLALDEPGPWVLAGDGLLAPRLEGAFLSGLSAGEAILESLDF